MKKIMVAFGIAIALIVSGFGIANCWSNMKAENDRAYQEHITKQIEREAETEAYIDQLGDALDYEYVQLGIFEDGINYW